MSGSPATPRAAEAPFPAWAKLLVLLAAFVALWLVAQALGRVLLVFLVSVVVALLLNPLVRALRRLRFPRGLAVLTVFLGFSAAIGLGVLLVIDPVRGQVEEIEANLPIYRDQADRQVASVQAFFDRNGIDVDVDERASDAIDSVQERVDQVANDILGYSLDVLGVLVTLIIILVAAIYMLLDAPRIARFAERLGGADAAAFLRRTERSLGDYLRAQLLIALIIATSSGAVLWVYGVTGLFPLGATFAVAFAAWVFLMEFIPYVGPILGAVPPTALALLDGPLTALWVVVAFVAIQQLEGNIVVPKIMGGAVGAHPLVVIFGLLVGEELAGIVGVLLAIPMVVIVKETVLYVADQLGGRRRLAAPEADAPAAAAEAADGARAPARPGPVGGAAAAAPREPPTTRVPGAGGLRPDA
jgi:predicted PurR-regulated permease PerM